MRVNKRRAESLIVLTFIISSIIITPILISLDSSNIYNLNLEKNQKSTEKDNGENRFIQTSSNSPSNTGYFQFYKVIKINRDKVEADLNDFPLMFSIYDQDLKDQVQSEGQDIAFSNGTDWLAHEIETFDQNYNPNYAKLVAWVRIPFLSGSADTIIYMYYGNSTMAPQQNPIGVWDDNYAGVWHLNQAPGDPIEDSTSNNHDGTTYNMQTDDLVSGQVGQGLEFDGYNDYIQTNSNELEDAEDITIEAWFKADSTSMGHIVWEGDSFQYAAYADGGGPHDEIHIGTGDCTEEEDNEISIFLKGASTDIDWAISFSDTTNFHHLVGVFSNISSSPIGELFLDGGSQGTDSADSISRSNWDTDLRIGRPGASSRYFDGVLDEIRVSTVARSVEWIETEYNNQYDPVTFYSVSGRNHVVRPTQEDFEYFKTITIDHTKISGSKPLINFPVLISIFDKDLRDDVQPDGDDILFRIGTEWLDHEIEFFKQNYNDTHAQLITWVKIPSLSPSSDTTINIYYGNSTLWSQEKPAGVWENNYRGVWHLLENSGDAIDSTLYNEYGTVSGTINQDANGQINGGYEFGTNGMVNIEGTSEGHLDFDANTNFSISFWINLDTTTGNEQIPLYKGGASPADEGYCFKISQEANFIQFYISDGNDQQSSDQANIFFHNWIYITGVVDRTNNYMHIYKDGVEVGSAKSISQIDSLTNQKSLRFPWDSYDLDGLLDEVRISNVSHSSDWIATEYINQNNPNNFYMIGPEQLAGLANIQVNAVDLYGYSIPNANVSIHNTFGIIKSALTDSDGVVVFQDINLGDYNFTVNMTSNTEVPLTASINITSEAFDINEPFHNITLICNVSRNVFTLTDLDGNPLESGWIIVRKGPNDIQNCSIDTSGQTIFRWLNDSGYDYIVKYRDNAYIPNEIVLASGVIPSPNTTIDLQVRLTTVEFTVYTADGFETISGVKLIIKNSTQGDYVVNLTSGFDGKATFRWLNTTDFYNYSLGLRFYGYDKDFNISGIGVAQGSPPNLNFSITSSEDLEIYMEITSSQLEYYETALISLNPTHIIQQEWGVNLTLRALFNITKDPDHTKLGPIDADLMWYEIYDDQDVFIKSGTMSIEAYNIGRYQCEVDTSILKSNIIYTIKIRAQKSEYRLPEDLPLSLYLLKNEVVLNQSENDDSIQIVYWQDSVNMSVNPYSKISEDMIIEDIIFHSIEGVDHEFQFSIPEILNEWNLTQITFNIYNIAWNVISDEYINITILGPYGEFLKIAKSNYSDVGSIYNWDENWWTGITFDLNKNSPTNDNTFNFVIGGSFDGTVDIVAEALFIRDSINAEYTKFNVSTDTFSILSDKNGWVINNITFEIYNCYNTSDWGNLIPDITKVIPNISPLEGQNYTLTYMGPGAGRLSISNITIFPFDNQFLFNIYKKYINIIFDVNISVKYTQEFYQNQYLESMSLTKAIQNFDILIDTFQISAMDDDWNDNEAILLINDITDGIDYFFPSELTMNITIGSQNYSISDILRGNGRFYLENIPDFNKNTLYMATISTNQPVNFTLSFIIENTRIIHYEMTGTITYEIQGTEITDTVQYDNNLGVYMQTVNTSLLYARSIPFTIEFTFNKDQYETQTKELDFVVKDRLTLISGSSMNLDIYPTIYVQDEVLYPFSYTDALFPSNITDLETQSYIITKITGSQSVSYRSGNLYVDSNNRYVLDIDTQAMPTGSYTIWITLDKQNYVPKQAILFLIINYREIEYDLGDMFEEKQTNVVKGEKITLSIELTDPTKEDIPLTGAKVILEIGDDKLEFEEVEDGVYELEFETDEYEAFFISNTFTGIITVSKANYSSEEIDITIVIEIEEIFDGIPTFYFLIFLSAIVTVIGSLATYKYIQLAKIPKFVKKARVMKKAIKTGNEISDSSLTSSKEQSILKQFENEWEELGISLVEVLGIKPKKDKVLSNLEGGAK